MYWNSERRGKFKICGRWLKKRSSEILVDENQEIFQEKVKILKFFSESKNFSKTGGKSETEGMHHGLRGEWTPLLTQSLVFWTTVNLVTLCYVFNRVLHFLIGWWFHDEIARLYPPDQQQYTCYRTGYTITQRISDTSMEDRLYINQREMKATAAIDSSVSSNHVCVYNL